MKGTIVYGQTATFQVAIPPEFQGSTRDMLRYMWEASNPDSGNATITVFNRQGCKLRSSMVGDIYIVNGGSYFTDSMGWVEIDEVTSIRAQKLGSRETIMGYKWLVKQHNFPNPISEVR